MDFITRDRYLKKLTDRKQNGMVKVITGIRRSGKSFLLDPIYKNHLLSIGVKEDHIIKLDLDERRNHSFLNPDKLDQYVRDLIVDDDIYYLLLDEVQKVEDFESVLNGFLHIPNLDVYVTGSNSKFLSSDIITEFRGRGDEIKVFPLSFSEFSSVFSGNKDDAWDEYLTYGGLPRILSLPTEEQKSSYLKQLFEKTYLSDIIERNHISKTDILDSLVNILASSVGSLTNPRRLLFDLKNSENLDVSVNTITSFLNYLEDAYLIEKAERYDVKGKKYIQTPYKFYFSDVGLRNARLNFRQQEGTHLMENVIFNELLFRGYNVDVGVVEMREGDNRKQVEVDFVCNQGYRRYYIQSAFSLPTREKTIQEERPLLNIPDNFKKIIVVKEDAKPWITEEGIVVMGVKEFLLNPDSLNF